MQLDIENYLNNLCCTTTPVATPPTITYPPIPGGVLNLYANQAINSLCPTLTGDTPITVTVSPSLPAGLNLNSSTGCITGTPTTTSALSSFTFTATNSAGTDTFDMDVEIFPEIFPIKIKGGAFFDKVGGDAYMNGSLVSGTIINSSFFTNSDYPFGVYSVKTTTNAEVGANFLTSGIGVEGYEDLTGLITKYGNGAFAQSPATSIKIGNNVTFGDTAFEYSTAVIEIGDNATFGLQALRNTQNVTIGDNATFGSASFINNSGVTTIGSDATFGTNAFPEYSSGGGSVNLQNFTATSDNSFFSNFTGTVEINFNGTIGTSTGDDGIFNSSLSANLGGVINARAIDATSNGGNSEGDLDFLTNLGLTVNYIL